MIIKLGGLQELRLEDANACIPEISSDALSHFKKIAGDLRKVAPKAEDFLYFSAVMMHAAEASGINDDGTPKFNKRGQKVVVGWDTTGNTYKWVTNDPNIKPYKNSNGDIFPEAELLRAYKDWRYKPLCVDHKSSSVEHVRGFIVDTYYDKKLKRVIALCALDRVSFPQLARQVETGVSTSVSMGTAVGRAICTECANVAQTERDFCDHMRRRTCYGEINADLKPIELSIVVNGADQKAQIKHIIAAKQTMENYLNRFSNLNYFVVKKASISLADLDDLSSTIQSLSNKIEDLKNSIQSEDENSEELSGNSETSSSEEDSLLDNVPESTDTSLQPPHSRLANDQKLMSDALAKLTASVKGMEQTIDNFSIKFNQQEENMATKKNAYYQGTEEPTPNQAKYEKDPLGEKAREEDKHLHGQMDTGPVEGMHPGPDSVGMSELERKKMLARAAAEQRAMRRQAAVEMAKKNAYYGGTEQPTPGKKQYPVDKLNEEAREEDHHLKGQKPFPGVGNVNGLHPSPESAEVSDELKRKELLNRASFKATFKRAVAQNGQEDRANSAWHIYNGDKLVVKASVKELSGGEVSKLYSVIATKPYGASLLETVRTAGADGVLKLIKTAQEAPQPEAPAAQPPAQDNAPSVEDEGKSGEKKDNVAELAQEALDYSEKLTPLLSDLSEAVQGLAGEQAEMKDVGDMTATASASLNSLRKELNSALLTSMKDVLAQAETNKEELDLIVAMSDGNKIDKDNFDSIKSIASGTFSESKTTISDGLKLLQAFVKYVRGSQAMVKKAQLEQDVDSLNSDDSNSWDSKDKSSADDELDALVRETNEELNSLDSLLSDSDGDSDEQSAVVELPKGNPLPQGLKENDVVKVTAADRDQKRAKLAAEAMKVSPMLQSAHPKGGFTPSFETKPEGDLARIEDLEEQHEAMMDVVNAPVKVRKEAEMIHKLISNGSLDPNDLDELVSEGLDKDAVSYYKKYFAQADGGSEFASELIKEHAKTKLAKQNEEYKLKITRAYELANQMAKKGLCYDDAESISKQAEEFMNFDDSSFETFKKTVAKAEIQQKRMPQVGLMGSGEVDVIKTASEKSLYEELSEALANTGRKGSF